MVLVLFGCVGLTAGLALGTFFSSNQSRAPFVLHVQFGCHAIWRHHSPWNMAPDGRVHPPGCEPLCPPVGCRIDRLAGPDQLPLFIASAPSGPLPVGGYALLGLLTGLSAGLGFLVPPRSCLIPPD